MITSRKTLRALIGSSLTLVVVIALATAVTALDPLDDQTSATPLPILTTTSLTVPDPTLTAVNTDVAAPNVGGGQSVDETDQPETDVDLSSRSDTGGETPAASGDDDASGTDSGEAALPTYGGTVYTPRSTSKSGTGTGSAGAGGDLPGVDGALEDGIPADDLLGNGAENASEPSEPSDITVSGVPGFGVGFSLLALGALVFFTSRRLRR